MRFDWKKALRALGVLAMVVIFGGVPLFFFLLFGMLGAFPLYVTYGGTALGAVGIVAFFLNNCGYLPQQAHRWVNTVMICVLVVSLGYVGHGFWRDSIPTLDDRSLVLWDYIPYAEDTKAVKLDEESTLHFPLSERLSLDGATALYPVYAGFVQAVYPPESGKHPYSPTASGRVECNGTITAYERLVSGAADIIFAASPSRDQLDMAAEAGMELHLTPIGREAFVFFVNSRNPVTALTVEQVQGIYTGDITNWSQVGGRNQSIRPFQRAENSGSQSALLRLMDGLPLLAPEEEDRIEGMGGIIRQVASYRNYKNAIGFSFRFYATEMVQNNDIRLLALDGVAPTKETIRDGSYPISSEFYAVTAAPSGKPAPRETDARIDAFLDWMTSSQGQEIVEKTGYVALG